MPLGSWNPWPILPYSNAMLPPYFELGGENPHFIVDKVLALGILGTMMTFQDGADLEQTEVLNLSC